MSNLGACERVQTKFVWMKASSRSLCDGSTSQIGRFAAFVRSCSALHVSTGFLILDYPIELMEASHSDNF